MAVPVGAIACTFLELLQQWPMPVPFTLFGMIRNRFIKSSE